MILGLGSQPNKPWSIGKGASESHFQVSLNVKNQKKCFFRHLKDFFFSLYMLHISFLHLFIRFNALRVQVVEFGEEICWI